MAKDMDGYIEPNECGAYVWFDDFWRTICAVRVAHIDAMDTDELLGGKRCFCEYCQYYQDHSTV